MNQEDIKAINFDLPKNRSNVIKVIGVGGGGSNAINYMFQQGIKGVDFIITNTDAQALSESGVPTKIQLGATLTEGLGAGANPEVGARAAQESIDEIHSVLSIQTKMVFITAGLGGGTGTGAAPIIAEMAKSLDILTVGIVTMPFQFEGRLRLEQAQNGLQRIKETVDALIVINNNKLREVYGNLGFKAGFAKADEVLATAARGIAEVITHHYTQNIDLKDAKTVLTDSGTAIMGSANSSGSNRAHDAIVKALDSPLLNDNKITGCKNVLLLIVSGSEEITIDEIGGINDYIQTEAGNNANIIMGVGEDQNLGSSVAVTIIATGFGADQQNQIVNTEAKKIIHTLEDDQPIEQLLMGETEEIMGFDSPIDLEQNKSITVKVGKLEEDNLEISNKEVKYDLDSEEILVNTIPPEIFDIPVSSEHVTIEKQDDDNEDDIILTDQIKNLEVIYEILEVNSSKEELLVEVEEEFTNNDFSINNLSNEVLDLEMVDEVIISADGNSENQFIFDFTPPNENHNGIDTEKLVYQSNEIDSPYENKEVDEAMAFKLEFIEKPEKPESLDLSTEKVKIESESPFDKSIQDIAASENDKRKEHLKKFNHAFKHSMSKIDEFEKQPAYKRLGLDLDQPHSSDSNESRVSLDNDKNDDIQLRSNNSFLHDNVD